jgi:flagellar biosynthetic protein FlhB
MAQQDLDQTEAATPHKLREAREKGNVPRSADWMACVLLAAACVLAYADGWPALKRLARLAARSLQRPAEADWSPAGMAHWLGQCALAAVGVLGPLLLTVVVVAVLGGLVQSGPVASFYPLSPDWSRLDPAQGARRVWSRRALVDAVKGCAKLLLLAVVVCSFLRHQLPGLSMLAARDPGGLLPLLVARAADLLARLVGILLLLAAADLAYTRWEYARRMRMSKREVKDEHKNREGDPRIRSRLRELRREALKRSQSVARVGRADVLLTNPTHLAIAISYEHGVSAAPQVIGKGAGALARRMRQAAARHGVPVVQNPPLARALFREVPFDAVVPEHFYPPLARIMVWVLALRQAGAPRPVSPESAV